jgi:hypothetical protein
LVKDGGLFLENEIYVTQGYILELSLTG